MLSLRFLEVPPLPLPPQQKQNRLTSSYCEGCSRLRYWLCPLLKHPSTTTSLDRYSALESARLVENEARYYDCSDRKATKSGPDTGFCLPGIARRGPFLPVSSS